MTVKKPNPGSKEAIEQGCTCPVMDNRKGKGIFINGKPCFWYTDTCPIHWFANLPEQEK